MLPTQKKKKDFVNPNENEFLFFPEKKKKRKTWRYYISISKKKKKTQKNPCPPDTVKQFGFKSLHKAQQLHSPSPFTDLFYYPGYSTCFFPQDVFGYDNPISLEIELSERKQGQRQGGCSQDWREEGKGKESP